MYYLTPFCIMLILKNVRTSQITGPDEMLCKMLTFSLVRSLLLKIFLHTRVMIDQQSRSAVRKRFTNKLPHEVMVMCLALSTVRHHTHTRKEDLLPNVSQLRFDHSTEITRNCHFPNRKGLIIKIRLQIRCFFFCFFLNDS